MIKNNPGERWSVKQCLKSSWIQLGTYKNHQLRAAMESVMSRVDEERKKAPRINPDETSIVAGRHEQRASPSPSQKHTLEKRHRTPTWPLHGAGSPRLSANSFVLPPVSSSRSRSLDRVERHLEL